MQGVERLVYNPDRQEVITLSFRGKNGRRGHEVRFQLPSRLSLRFHWWMMSTGIVKA